MRRRIVAGNWKLHGDRKFACALVEEIAAAAAPAGVDRIVLPPLPYLGELCEHFDSRGVQAPNHFLKLPDGAIDATGNVTRVWGKKAESIIAPVVHPPTFDQVTTPMPRASWLPRRATTTWTGPG